MTQLQVASGHFCRLITAGEACKGPPPAGAMQSSRLQVDPDSSLPVEPATHVPGGQPTWGRPQHMLSMLRLCLLGRSLRRWLRSRPMK